MNKGTQTGHDHKHVMKECTITRQTHYMHNTTTVEIQKTHGSFQGDMLAKKLKLGWGACSGVKGCVGYKEKKGRLG